MCVRQRHASTARFAFTLVLLPLVAQVQHTKLITQFQDPSQADHPPQRWQR